MVYLYIKLHLALVRVFVASAHVVSLTLMHWRFLGEWLQHTHAERSVAVFQYLVYFSNARKQKKVLELIPFNSNANLWFNPLKRNNDYITRSESKNLLWFRRSKSNSVCI